MKVPSVTRGRGLLENVLARQREKMANRIISARAPSAYRLLDIGCGSFPFFLSRSPFREKYGLDQQVDDGVVASLADSGVTLLRHDVERSERLPFRSEFFDIVTMLAVFEHIRSDRLPHLIGEIQRVLRPGGIYVLTTPARWTEPLLTLLSRCGLISSVEIDDHEETYTHERIATLLSAGGFDSTWIDRGSFELGMNLWACAVKRPLASESFAESVDRRREIAAGRPRARTA